MVPPIWNRCFVEEHTTFSDKRYRSRIRCGCESISESSLVVRRRPGSPIRRYQRMRSFFRRLRSIRPSGSSLPDHGAIGKLSNEESSFELLRNGEISSVDEKNSDVGRCRKVAVLDRAGFVAAPRGGQSGFYFINGEVVWFTRNYHVLGQMNVDDDATVTNTGSYLQTVEQSEKFQLHYFLVKKLLIFKSNVLIQKYSPEKY
jgi:hypothetical protein